MGRIILLLFAAYIVLNIWILWWFWRALRGTGFARWAVCLSLLALMAFFPLFYPHGRSSGTALETLALTLGCVWIGSFVYVFVMTVAADVVNFFAARYREAGKFSESWLAFLIVAVAMCLAIGGWLNAAYPVLRETRLRVKAARNAEGELPRPLSIAAMADLHFGRVNGVRRLSRAIDRIAPRNPDLVLFLGDMIDDHLAVDEAGLKEQLHRLSPSLGIWGILGNHEYISGPVDVSIAILENAGIRVLRDVAVGLDSRVALVGRDDLASAYFGGSARKDLGAILAEMDRETAALPLVVLDHQPRYPEDAEKAGAVLQLSGHTHNGQLWPYNFIVSALYENARGHSLRGDTNYIVTVGTGTWGPPMRNNARPEALWVELEFVD